MLDLGYTFDEPETMDMPAKERVMYPSFYIENFKGKLPDGLDIGEVFSANVKLKICSLNKSAKNTSLNIEVIGINFDDKKESGINEYL